MSVIQKFFGTSPFGLLLEHTKKVHECVELMQPLTQALFDNDRAEIEKLHNDISLKEHEADEIKTLVRDKLAKAYLLSVRREDLMRFLSYQDDVADAAEDYAVVLLIRNTQIPEELKEDFLNFVMQVIKVSEHLLELAEELSSLAESAFTGKEAEKFLEGIAVIGEEEWKADRLQRKFAMHFYSMESELDPTSLRFLDKYGATLGEVANSAEKTAKYLRQLIGGR